MKSILFLAIRSSKSHHLLLQSVRHMGGGPRTFPGGINKWQWKRLHEKKAKEKEGKLLHQEKQLYQARIRSDIRSKLSQPDPNHHHPHPHNYTPISPQQHIKSLADRFMKEGAEDLWNEADGPTQQSTTTTTATADNSNSSSSSNKRKPAVAKNSYANSRNDGFGFFANLSKSRNYSSVSATSTKKFTKCEAFGNFGCRSSCYYLVGATSMFERNGGVGNLGNWLRYRNYCVGGGGTSSGFSGYEGFGNLSRGSSYRRCCSVGISRSLLEDGGFGELGGWLKCRHFSVGGGVVKKRRSRYCFRKNDDSSSESDVDDEMANNLARRNFRFGSDGEDDEEMRGRGNGRKKMMSSAALGNYDKKIKRRIPLQFVENEDDLSQHVEVIRKEVDKRKMENDGGNGDEETMLSEKRFDECNVSPLTVKALTSAGYVQMTRVQEATLSAYLEGKDALVKAKTGTGKSVAFLLPAIETVLKASSSKSLRVTPIYVLILCPTRELASQIGAEANVLLKLHDGIGVQTLVGGTRFKVDQKSLESDPCQIIVATPGRLLDHIENKSSFSTRLMGLNMLILDEADHLLDLGFRKDMEKIVDCLPRQRQSLLFSATIPKEVRRISQLVLKREHAYIDTVGLGCIETPMKVKQSYLVGVHEQHFQIVNHLLKEHISQEVDYKVIVFCTTAMMTSLMFSLFRDLKYNVRELHSRKPQLYRTRISDEFRESKRLILITSYVSARGMNYPDVTLVLQVGIPSDREQYIHRLGRTGREGKTGESILLIAPWENYFLDEVKDLPLEKLSLPSLNLEMTQKVVVSMAKIDNSIKEAAYHAWLGYYNSNRDIGRDKTTLVELAKKFCESIGLQKPPSLFRKTALKMGLKDIAGIRIRK